MAGLNVLQCFRALSGGLQTSLKTCKIDCFSKKTAIEWVHLTAAELSRELGEFEVAAGRDFPFIP